MVSNYFNSILCFSSKDKGVKNHKTMQLTCYFYIEFKKNIRIINMQIQLQYKVECVLCIISQR